MWEPLIPRLATRKASDLYGACPVPTSSTKTNRGGNRQANSALHTMVVSRIRIDERNQAYMQALARRRTV